MKPLAYYNEFDPFAAAWLRELINAGHIAPGYVDERSITDVHPENLEGFTQCHFFAGIGVWSLALRAAGWPDDRPVWTGSCPCQPFSAAGKAAGTEDERHLWPAFHRLVDAVRPAAVLGEQVSGALVIGRAGGKPKETDGPAWLDAVFADLEGSRYACGAVAFAAAGVGAPHIRDRLYWLGVAGKPRLEGQPRHGDNGYQPRRLGAKPPRPAAAAGDADRLADVGRTGTTDSFWRDPDWLFCRDGKWRPVEPGAFPLAHGAANRVGLLRGYGNAVNAQAAQAFVESVMEVIDATEI